MKNADPSAEEVPLKVSGEGGRERYGPHVVLDLDYVVVLPRRSVILSEAKNPAGWSPN